MERTFDLQRPARRLLRRSFDLRREAAEIDKGERVERAREQQNDDDDETEKFPHGSCPSSGGLVAICPAGPDRVGRGR